jgi:hypothetical protein
VAAPGSGFEGGFLAIKNILNNCEYWHYRLDVPLKSWLNVVVPTRRYAMQNTPLNLDDYRPTSPAYQGRLREDLQQYKAHGANGRAYADLVRWAKKVAKATGLTVQEIFEQA